VAFILVFMGVCVSLAMQLLFSPLERVLPVAPFSNPFSAN